MFLYKRLIHTATLLACLSIPVQALAIVQPADASVTPADTAGSSDTSATAGGKSASTNWRLAFASCQAGAELASTNPALLSGAGLIMCLVGIYFDAHDE